MSLTKQIVSISELFRARQFDIKNIKKSDVTRDNSQRRFIGATQRCNIVPTLFQMVATLFQNCNTVLHVYNSGAVVIRNICFASGA